MRDKEETIAFIKSWLRSKAWQLMFFFMIIVWIKFPTLITNVFHVPDDPVARGQFGDMYGALNTLFSALGFAGLLYSLNLQREQFQASLDDMKGNAAAAREEAAAMDKQTNVLRSQNRIRVQEMKIARISAKLNSQSLLFQAFAGLDRGHSQLKPIAQEIERLEGRLAKIQVNKLPIE